MKCPLAFCPEDNRDFVNTTSLYRHITNDHTFEVTVSYLVHQLFKKELEK